MARIKRAAAVFVLWLAVAFAWHALHHRHAGGRERAVEHWLDAMATGDAGEFCASTTVALQVSNLGHGACPERAPALLRRIRPAWAPFKGARATRASAGGVAAADVVLADGSRMSDWRFGGFAHAGKVIRVVHVGGAWRVDG